MWRQFDANEEIVAVGPVKDKSRSKKHYGGVIGADQFFSKLLIIK